MIKTLEVRKNKLINGKYLSTAILLTIKLVRLMNFLQRDLMPKYKVYIVEAILLMMKS